MSPTSIENIAFSAIAFDHSDSSLLLRIAVPELFASVGLRMPPDASPFEDIWLARGDILPTSEVRENGGRGLLRVRRELGLLIAWQLCGRHSIEQAHAVYRQLAKENHPDSNVSECAGAVMTAINRLWAALQLTAPGRIATSLPGAKP